MFRLKKIQEQLTGFILDNSLTEQLSQAIKTNGIGPVQRLQIYRNNTRLGLTEALRDGYPVVNKLVGEDFFNYLTHEFLQRHLPQSGCLLTFGENFADFIANFEPARDLPYLPDIAKLEWLWHQAFHEADTMPLDIQALAKVGAEHYGALGFALHPTARFLVSEYPVLPIWTVNQDDHIGDNSVNLDQGACRVLIYRPRLTVQMLSLTSTEYSFLCLLEKKVTLLEANEQIINCYADFDVIKNLQHWVGIGLITDFYYA